VTSDAASEPTATPTPTTTPTPTSRHERHASWTELFFDLVAVAGLASLAHLLLGGLDLAALGLYALLYLAFWLAWTTYMLYGNVAADSTHLVRLLIGMFGLGVMAAAVPGVGEALLHGEGGGPAPNAFALAYVLARVYGAQSWRRGEVLLDFPVAQHTVGVLPWVVSLWVDEPWKVALWAAGVALDLLLVLVVSGDELLERQEERLTEVRERRRPQHGQRGQHGQHGTRHEGRGQRPQRGTGRVGPLRIVGVRTDPEHLSERLGLFMIIVLGEGVAQVVDASAETDYHRGTLAAGLAAFVLLTGIFGLSVVTGFAGLPHLQAGSVDARIGLGLHCLVTGVVATLAVALGTVAAAPAEPVTDRWRWLLCGAVASYFALGLVASVASHGLRPVPAVASLVTGVAFPVLLGFLATGVSGTALVAVVAIVVLGHLWAERRTRRVVDV
jgi:low temperature requirement protein LtrA